MVVFRVIGLLTSLCYFTYWSSSGRTSMSYGIQFFKFGFSTDASQFIYSSTIIGYVILIIINHIDRQNSKARAISLLLSYLALFSMIHELLRMGLGYGWQFVLILPICIAPCELLLMFKRHEPGIPDNKPLD